MKPTVWIYAPTGDLCVYTPMPPGSISKEDCFTELFEQPEGEDVKTFFFCNPPPEDENFIHLGEL